MAKQKDPPCKNEPRNSNSQRNSNSASFVLREVSQKGREEDFQRVIFDVLARRRTKVECSRAISLRNRRAIRSESIFIRYTVILNEVILTI